MEEGAAGGGPLADLDFSESLLREITSECGVLTEDCSPDTLLAARAKGGAVDLTLLGESWARQDAELAFYLRGEAASEEDTTKPKATRPFRTSYLWRFVSGVWQRKDPLTSQWYMDYVLDPRKRAKAPSSAAGMKQFNRKFRSRFRLPHECFVSLVQDCREHGWFRSYCSRNLPGLDQPGANSTKTLPPQHHNINHPPSLPLSQHAQAPWNYWF
jgi:hypothetical protein